MNPMSTQQTCWFVVLCCTLCTPIALAADARSSLDAWINLLRDNPATEVQWYVAQEVVDRATRVVDDFEIVETARYRYPIAMLVQSRVIPKNEPEDARRSMRFDLDQEISETGHWTERHAHTGAERDLGDGHELRDMIKAQAVRNPALLGMWINEHPDKCEIVEGDDGRKLFLVPDLNLRFELRLANESDPASAWVSRLEVVGADGSSSVWWTYDDPIRVENARFSLGSVRVQHSVARDGSLYEGTPSVLEYARLIPASVQPAATSPADPIILDENEPNGPDSSTQQPSGSLPRWTIPVIAVATLLAGFLTVWAVRSRR
jgi:hypothetical protein